MLSVTSYKYEICKKKWTLAKSGRIIGISSQNSSALKFKKILVFIENVCYGNTKIKKKIQKKIHFYVLNHPLSKNVIHNTFYKRLVKKNKILLHLIFSFNKYNFNKNKKVKGCSNYFQHHHHHQPLSHTVPLHTTGAFQ